MRICEFAGDKSVSSPAQLLALTTFLKDRAEDENAQAQISQAAFIDLAQSLGVNVTDANLADMIAQPPLSNVLEPVDPNSGVLRFKGNTEVATGMSVDQARAVVDSNAKAALKRRQ
jgi:ATP phosphoribosyltransferase regulatory subunit HisZ